jgi:3-oxoacyl-[acyl-carrier-protein] synthase-3
MHYSRVRGQGAYLPEKVLTNQDLEKLVDTTDQWIRERTGIERRHHAAPGQNTTDLAKEASLMALKDAGLAAEDIELIIFCTVTGDQPMPSSGCVLQDKLGLKNIPAFDLSAACSGFVYGLVTADQFIRAGTYKRVLVVGAEIIHRYVNYADRETCILFGDGAGAFILERTEEKGSSLGASELRAEGSLGDLFVLPAGGTAIPFSQEVLDRGQHWVKMKGREIFKNAVRTMSACCQKVIEKEGISIDQVDWLIPHQANYRIMEAVAEHFNFPKEKVISVVHETGNTSAASIPLAFNAGVKDGRIKRGQTILFTAFGAGLTAGALIFRY